MALARKRSLQSIGTQSSPSSANISRASSLRERSTGTDLLKVNNTNNNGGSSSRYSFESSHPFGKELAKLSEVAEELSGVMRENECEDDIEVMLQQGLSKWTVDDYLRELQPLYLGNFATHNHPAALAPAWI